MKDVNFSYLQGKNVLVTGGAGFIGSHLVDRLLSLGAKVIVYDNFDDFYAGKEENIKHHEGNENFRLVKADILDRENLLLAMSDVQLLFHQAAQPGIRYCSDYPRKAHEANATGTFNVLEAAKKAGVSRVVFASSSSIFGLPKYAPIDEAHPTNPESVYGASKLAAEKYCTAFAKTFAMNVVSMRYFSVYGPRGRPDQAVYRFAEKLRNSESPIIYGEGQQTRDFTYVTDIVDAVLRAAVIPLTAGEVFNIGYGAETSVEELFLLLREKMNRRSIRPIHKPSYPGEFPRTIANNAKARTLLSWEPKVPLNEGLDLFVKWYLSEG